MFCRARANTQRALAAHLALTLPCFAPRLIRIVKLPAPECHALVVVAVWCQASITWPWAPQSRAIAWASQFVRAESVFDRVILTLRQTSSSHQDSNARSTDSASAITRCTRSLWYSWFLLQPHVAAVCGSRLRQRSLRAHAGRNHAGCGLGPRRACVVRGIRGAGFVCATTLSCASYCTVVAPMQPQDPSAIVLNKRSINTLRVEASTFCGGGPS